MENLAILLTCHNRKEKTIECLKTVYDQTLPKNLNFQVIVVDDGSTDGTEEAVKKDFPSAVVIKGSGYLYWAGGMRKAIDYAMHNSFDFHLWLNDDTVLFKDSILKLFQDVEKLPARFILTGATMDPETKNITYGGFRKKYSFSPLHLKMVKPEGHPVAIDCMNGNCVLIPKIVFREIGNLDTEFTHGLADLDYGLSATKKGIKVFLASDCVGYCKRNVANTRRRSLSRIKSKLSVKNMPFKEWRYYVKKNGGLFWPYYLVAPYIKALITKG